MFYDEDTEEEEEEEEESPPAQQTEERPESVLTDVTVDGLGDPDIGDLPGRQGLHFMIDNVFTPSPSMIK